jgi:hypothetical protein
MNCCPSADIDILPNGIKVREKLVQTDGHTLQFFPYRAIQSVRYNHTRTEGGILALWILGHGTPGAGGLSYRYSFPCTDSGQRVFEQIMAAL